MPDYVRDVGFCRSRLSEIGLLLGEEEPNRSDPKSEALILPAGCKTIGEAADQFLASLPPEDILEFDQSLQKELTKRFRGLVNLCLRQEKTTDFITLLNSKTRAYLDKHFQKEDPASIFLRYVGDEAQAKEMILKGIESAAPKIHSGDPDRDIETLVLAAPASEQGNHVLQLAVAACPKREFIPAPLDDDMLIFREFPRLPMPMLPQLGLLAREAYKQQLGSDHHPHSRVDVSWPTSEE